MTIPKPPPNLSRRHVEAFGSIITWWVILEDLLATVIIQFFSKDEFRGWIMLGQMEFRAKSYCLEAWIKTLPKDKASEELLSILKDMSTAYTMRNLIAHRMWKKGRKKGWIKPIMFESRGAVKLRGHHHNEPNWSVKNLGDEAMKLKKLYGRLSAFHRSYHKPQKASP